MNALDRLREEALKPLEEAHSLSFTAYTDETVYAEEVRKIFHGEWVFACQAPELGDPGDYFAMSLAGLLRGGRAHLRARAERRERHQGARRQAG